MLSHTATETSSSRVKETRRCSVQAAIKAAATVAYLAVVTNGATLDCHAQQPSAVAFSDLHFEMLTPTVIAVGVPTLHCSGSINRNITEAASTFYVP